MTAHAGVGVRAGHAVKGAQSGKGRGGIAEGLPVTFRAWTAGTVLNSPVCLKNAAAPGDQDTRGNNELLPVRQVPRESVLLADGFGECCHKADR
jgi:hypothetical protein